MRCERSLIRERTQARLAAARRIGRTGGRLPKLTDDEFRQRAEHVEDKPPLRGRRVEGFGQAAKADTSHPQFLDG
jgi:DNA invertase Pin-like site-specific DNA recombinase